MLTLLDISFGGDVMTGYLVDLCRTEQAGTYVKEPFHWTESLEDTRALCGGLSSCHFFFPLGM